jgi:hypothetical protein
VKWFALIALLFASIASANCESHWFGVITVSKHIAPARKYNEKHWGPYYRCQFDRRWSAQGGWYPNSYKRDTWYAMAVFTPIDVPAFGQRIRIGAALGAGTGYAEHSDGRPKTGLTPLAGGIAALEINRKVSAGIFFNPAVMALIMEAKF